MRLTTLISGCTWPPSPRPASGDAVCIQTKGLDTEGGVVPRRVASQRGVVQDGASNPGMKKMGGRVPVLLDGHRGRLACPSVPAFLDGVLRRSR